MSSPNCYDCIHRRSVPGDAHSSCAHPAIGKTDSNPFAGIFDMLMGKNDAAIEKLGIRADPHGVRCGWFLWPANFDPAWLRACNGFTAKTPTATPTTTGG